MITLNRIAEEKGYDLRAHLREQHTNLGRFLKQFEPDIEVHNKGASDMLVGIPGAEEKRIEQPRVFRKDVFEAFSQFDKIVYYDKDRDEFVIEPDSSVGLLEGPRITKAAIFEDRAAFAKTQSEPLRGRLVEASAPASALSQFMKVVISGHLQKEWLRFRSLRVADRVTEWALANGIEPRPNWFRKSASVSISPRALLHGLLEQMTDEEIRDLRVSVRAVESLVRRGRLQIGRE
jgi:hypothetical protein